MIWMPKASVIYTARMVLFRQTIWD
jgi:hypothetical protein